MLFQQVLEQFPNDVKLVIKHFPLTSHKFAKQAAKAALAADRQGKFWEFHHLLFKNYKRIDDQKIQEIATALGLDLERFNADVQSPDIATLIQRDLANGRAIGVRGTPTIFINGKRLQTRSLQGFKDMIMSELNKDR